MDFKGINGFAFDFDGVVWHGDKLVAGARETILRLKAEGKKVVYLTNNTTKSRREYAGKLRKLGIKAVSEDVFTSSYATAVYIKRRYGRSKIFPIGTKGLVEELRLQGHKIVKKNADFVVMGFSTEVNYNDIKEGYKKIVDEGARFIACNYDRVANHGDGIVPVLGPFVLALEYATGVKAKVIGKPNKTMAGIILKKLNLKASECLMMGDNLETDILFGKNAGMKTALALTGVHDRKDIAKLGIKPDFVINSIRDINVKPPRP